MNNENFLSWKKNKLLKCLIFQRKYFPKDTCFILSSKSESRQETRGEQNDNHVFAKLFFNYLKRNNVQNYDIRNLRVKEKLFEYALQTSNHITFK